MKIVFVSNHIHHHQFPLSSELYRLTNGQYRFVEMQPLSDEFKKNGYPQYNGIDWIIRAWESNEKMKYAQSLAENADVLLYGGIYPFSWIKARLDRRMITFEIGERWLKRGLINLLSPRLLRHQWWYHRHFSDKPLYRLNAGAYASDDMRLLHSFRNKCFKWGYFTDTYISGTEYQKSYSRSGKVKLMWCARLIPLKHPELAVRLANELKLRNIDFELNIYGNGELRANIETLIKSLKLENHVYLRGNRPNTELLEEMRKSDIFLFTSNRREGWGAVVNEAMSAGCAVVCSDSAGCAPWLIRQGETGFTYRTNSFSEMTGKVLLLIEDRKKCQEIGEAGARLISEQWSPHTAAARLLNLIDNLKNGKKSPFAEGVCSPD